MHERTKNQALAALEGMREIVKREMLVRGIYVSDEIINPKLAEQGATCQGRQYCAIGSLWIAGGVPLDVTYARDYRTDDVILGEDGKPEIETVSLPGTDYGSPRNNFLRNRHGLRAAYKALNEASVSYMKRNAISFEVDEDGLGADIDVEQFGVTIEALFEGHEDLGRKELLGIISSAKRIVQKA